MAVLTTETRLGRREAGELVAYLVQWAPEFSAIERFVWQRVRAAKGSPDRNRLYKDVMARFGVTKRTANSAIADMLGRWRALKELKRCELAQLNAKAGALEEKVAKDRGRVGELKTLAADNTLSEEGLADLRKAKAVLWNRARKLERLRAKAAKLAKAIQDETFGLCFGTRKLFGAQHLLSENAIPGHSAWLERFRAKRDSGVFYLGAKGESLGNQMLQLEPVALGVFHVKLRKDGGRVASKQDRYVGGWVRFDYLADELADVLRCGGQAVAYRVCVRGGAVYLKASFEARPERHPVVTCKARGVVACDFNDGHLDLAETDACGNLVDAWSVPLSFHGCGNRARNEVLNAVADIGGRCVSSGKSLAIEDLDFRKRKATTVKSAKNRGRNKMLHALDHSRFASACESMGARRGVEVVKVNPAYTSQVAKAKYCPERKLPSHNGAAYVIGRRGQGFRDARPKKKAPARKRMTERGPSA